MRSPQRRLSQLAQHVGAAAVTEQIQEPLPRANGRINHGFLGGVVGDVYRDSLGDKPRVSQDLSSWSSPSLIRRCAALGATDDQIAGCVEAGSREDVLASLASLAYSLEPGPPETCTVADITVQPSDGIDAMVGRLEEFGAVIIEAAAPESLIAQTELELTSAGAFGSEGREKPKAFSCLLHSPALCELMTNEHLLGSTRALLGRHCKRIALKELFAVEIPPGRPRQQFHREDQFWPWHHEPDAWCVSVLWAIDTFTEENGGTRVIPFSHRARMRESGKEMMDGTYTEDQVLHITMPRGSVLIFTGGLVHGAGENRSERGRKSILSGYQLGWLRPEIKFWAHRPMHDALAAGDVFSDEMAELLGHYDKAKEGEDTAEWAGHYREDGYLGRLYDQVNSETDGDDALLVGARGYEPGPGGQ